MVNKTLSTFLRVVIIKISQNLRNVEFAYKKVVHRIAQMSPFEIVYSSNPLAPLDLIALLNISQVKDKSVQVKAEYVKKLHEQVKAQIEKRIEGYAKQANKRRKKVVFEPTDLVWVQMRKKNSLDKENPRTNLVADLSPSTAA